MPSDPVPSSPSHGLSPALPPGFVLGAATAAAQIEGGASSGGRGPSIWDAFCAQPGKIADASNVDVACDHFHRMEADVQQMAWLGLDAYRFSIAWPRVQPLGRGAWNEAGFAFYDRLIDECLAHGIAPHATLYHWDLPQALEEGIGGWLSREVVQLFADYAAEVARRFGGRLASIATHNEPWCTATKGYERGEFAPGHHSRAEASQVAHHLLLSHGAAVAAMRPHTRAPLGIVLNHTPAFPAEPTESDRRAARLADGLSVRFYMDPLFLGHYPPDVLAHLGADTPVVQPGDMALIQQPLDFLGINFYTRDFVSTRQPALRAPGALGFTEMNWEVYPEALTQHLVRLSREYLPPPIFITENGMANADEVVGGTVADPARAAYLRSHLQAVARAIEMGVEVGGYFYWSLLDNFEWEWGYTKRFGLLHVDFDTQQRTPKDSAHWYRGFIASQRARRLGPG
jgi:beta-glucosidase